MANIRQILKTYSGGDVWTMITRLNRTISGWCNYHRHSCSSKIFNWFDTWLFWTIKHWLHLRHRDKRNRWLQKKYYRYADGRQWTFHATRKESNGKKQYRDLINAGRINIVRHVKVRADANPFDPDWHDYFINRKKSIKSKSYDSRFVEETGWF